MLKTSIIICTYNREAYLPKCLEHLRLQTADRNSFEIVLINNNSSDNTDAICKAFQQNNPELNITYVIETTPGLSAARNCGIENSKGEILCFIDDDGFAVAEYVSIIQDFAENPKYQDFISFGGKVIPCYNEGKEPLWLSKYIDGVVSKVDLGEKIKDFDRKYPAGCNMIFRRKFFEDYGGFNADLHTRGDDKFVFDKLKKAGLKTLYIPQLKVEHFIDDYRLEASFIKRLSKIIGQSEAIRLRNESFLQKLIKFGEYLFKFGAACMLAIGFLFQGAVAKSKFILMVRWYVIIGFFIKSKI
jgi:glycosyltransferase involved in cell wall biosynthesis